MFQISKQISFTGVLRSLTGVALSFVFAITAHAAGADVTVGSNSISASATVTDATSIELRVAGGPNDYFAAQSSDTGSVTWDASYGLADGEYRYEVFVTVGTEAEGGDGAQSYRETGRFEVQGGSLSSSPANVGPGASLETNKAPSLMARMAKAVLDFIIPEVHAVDHFVTSTNPRINLEDTTNAGSGSVFDWLIWADYGNGIGSGYFRLWDNGIAQNNVFMIEQASALENTDHSLHVSSNGDIGLANDSVFIDKSANRMGIGTITPTRNLHITDNNPAIVLDDVDGVRWTINNNGGAAFFDIAAFHIATSTTRIPFFMHYTAPTNSFYMNSIGRIGMGTSNPVVPLHVSSQDNKSAGLLVQNTVAPTAAGDVQMFNLKNAGTKIVRFGIQAGGSNSLWTFDNNPNYNAASGVNSGRFRIAKSGTGIVEFSVDGFGNTRAPGVAYALFHQNTSSRASKTAFKDLDERDVLNKLISLPVTEWRYKQDGSRHFGPVAEEFQQVFGLGDGKHISTVDTAGVTMAAVQGLYKVVQDKDKKIQALRDEKDAELSKLREENSSLAERLKVLEDLILTREVASLSLSSY